MASESVLREAEFDPAVKTYWRFSVALALLLSIGGIPLLLIWLPFASLFINPYLARISCTLTEQSLKVKKGLLFRVEKTLPLDKITDMAMIQGPLMRLFGVMQLKVETAGQSGAGSLVGLTGIVDAEAFREAVLAQRDKLQVLARAGGSGGSETDDDALRELRDSVLRIEKMLQARG